MALAISFRIFEIDFTSKSSPVWIICAFRKSGFAAGGGVATAGFVAVFPAASMSRAMMRPRGPEPLIREISTPVFNAMFLANGEIRMRFPDSCSSISNSITEGISSAFPSDFSASSAENTFALPGANSSVDSPLLPITATLVSTGTSSPSSKNIASKIPSASASSSNDALSVS